MRVYMGLFLMMFTALTQAEVISKSEHGFDLQFTVALPVETRTAWAQLLRVQEWWHPDHTWSGKTKNLSLEPKAGGCFCEQLPQGSVQHLQVVFADKNRLLRLRGALGPLQEMAVDGVMNWEIVQGKDGSQITMSYRVFGYKDGGLSALSEPVNQVLALQFQRYQDALQKQLRP